MAIEKQQGTGKFYGLGKLNGTLKTLKKLQWVFLVTKTQATTCKYGLSVTIHVFTLVVVAPSNDSS